jgi:hypothetical protein
VEVSGQLHDLVTLPLVTFGRGLVGPQSQSGCYEDGKNRTMIPWSSSPDLGIDFNIIYLMEIRVKAAGSWSSPFTCLILRFKMYGALHPLSLYTFTAWCLDRGNFTFYVSWFIYFLHSLLNRKIKEGHRVRHVACMGKKRNGNRVLVGKANGKKPLRRSQHRWEDNKMDVNEICELD